MRDDRNRWAPPAPLSRPLSLGSATLCAVSVSRQTLISGPAVRSGKDALVGWPDIAVGDAYRIVLRRDRIVEIGCAPQAEGWNADQGEAASDITDGFDVYELSGPGAFDILKRGTEISLDHPSASVARRAFGFDLWIYRHTDADRFRIHIARAYGTALVATLTDVTALMPGGTVR